MHEPTYMYAYTSSESYVLRMSDPKWIYVVDTGCPRHLLRSSDALTRLKPVKKVAVNGVNGRKFVEKAGIHRAVGRCFVASWA